MLIQLNPDLHRPMLIITMMAYLKSLQYNYLKLKVSSEFRVKYANWEAIQIVAFIFLNTSFPSCLIIVITLQMGEMTQGGNRQASDRSSMSQNSQRKCLQFRRLNAEKTSGLSLHNPRHNPIGCTQLRCFQGVRRELLKSDITLLHIWEAHQCYSLLVMFLRPYSLEAVLKKYNPSHPQ